MKEKRLIDNSPDWFLSLFGIPALVTVAFRGFSLHLGVRKKEWVWGYTESWFDGPLPMVGLGPLFLFCWVFDFEYSYKWEYWHDPEPEPTDLEKIVEAYRDA